ncbi:MAG: glycosyltransferase [Candidatus Aenigmatarchaeota archaeon]
MLVSAILPVYNESAVLRSSVRRLERALEKTEYDYEIIISEDGSTDGTEGVAEELAKKNKKIRFIHSAKRLGKGGGIKKSLKYAKGEVLFFTDIDLSADLACLDELIEGAKENSICVGSRMLPDSKVDRQMIRSIASRVYNLLVRLLFKTEIKDMQCGFKAFHKNMKNILLAAKSNGWFWDTEVLLLAERNRIKVKQIPVKWVKGEESKTRLIGDGVKLFLNLASLRLRM